MYGVSVGVSNIGQSLPRAVYALLSGLNSATVGIIALAAVQLAEKAITDRLTRVLVFLGAAAGMLYNAALVLPYAHAFCFYHYRRLRLSLAGRFHQDGSRCYNAAEATAAQGHQSRIRGRGGKVSAWHNCQWHGTVQR